MFDSNSNTNNIFLPTWDKSGEWEISITIFEIQRKERMTTIKIDDEEKKRGTMTVASIKVFHPL